MQLWFYYYCLKHTSVICKTKWSDKLSSYNYSYHFHNQTPKIDEVFQPQLVISETICKTKEGIMRRGIPLINVMLVEHTYSQFLNQNTQRKQKNNKHWKKCHFCCNWDIYNSNTTAAKNNSSKALFALHNGILLGPSGINSLEHCTMTALQLPRPTQSTCISKIFYYVPSSIQHSIFYESCNIQT